VITLTGLSNAWWLAVLSHLWQTAIVLAVISLLTLAMRRAPARLLNALWWIGLAKLLVPLELGAPVLKRALGPIAAGAQGTGVRLPAISVWLQRAASVLDPAASVRAEALGGAEGVGVVLLALWSIGAVWLAVSWAGARAKWPRRNVAAWDEMPADVRVRLSAALSGTGIPRSAVRVTSDRLMPATVGAFQRRIIVPAALVARLDGSELRAVLLHEDAHRRRFEPLQVAIARTAAAAFYFFPPVWPLLGRLRETSEMACDEAAVRRGVPPGVYARALAHALAVGLEPVACTAPLARGTPSLTRRRFERLRNEGRVVLMRRHWLCLAIAGIAVIVVSASTVTTLATADDESQASTPATMSVAPVARAVEGAVSRAAGSAIAEAEEVAEEAKEDAEKESAEERTWSITLVDHADPEYPEDAKAAGANGEVLLKLTIESDGTVSDVLVLEGVEEFPSFEAAAEAAVREWSFVIVGEVDENEELEVVVPIHFKLHGERTREIGVKIPDAHAKPERSEDTLEPDEPPAAEEPPEPDEPPAKP
jgi:TonB family protein